jgi:hypothetical protein
MRFGTSPETRPMREPPAVTPRPEVRTEVKRLLTGSKAFAALSPEKQRQIAHDTAKIADHLAAPLGIPGNELPNAQALVGNRPVRALADDPSASNYQRDLEQVNRVSDDFKAQAAREGAEVAGALLQKVNFPTFVASLIKGVFHAIVEASIEQMEAYGSLVASVAKSLNQFRDENVSANQGRDHLVEQFPDLFQIGEDGLGGGPRVQLRDEVDEDAALKRVNEALPVQGGALTNLDLQDEDTEQKLVQAARTQLATSRQQLLATMVLMGINRIVVTDGKIQAKILYDFQARDNTRRQRSAAAFDHARDRWGNVQRTYNSEGDFDQSYEGGETSGKWGEDSYERRDGSWYSKGTYKYTQQPIMTAMSAASETSDSALQTRASLAGVVDINFKSDYFPLEKMADSFQIGQIQNAAKPAAQGTGGGAPGAATATTAPSATTPTQQPAQR